MTIGMQVQKDIANNLASLSLGSGAQCALRPPLPLSSAKKIGFKEQNNIANYLPLLPGFLSVHKQLSCYS